MSCLCQSHQASGVGVDAVGGVDELRAGFGVLRKLLVVVEPAVLGSREALVLQASQLRGRSNGDRLGDATPRNHRFHCTQTQSDQWFVLGKCTASEPHEFDCITLNVENQFV